MKKFLLFSISASVLAMAGFLSSCDGDEETFDAPTISLSETAVTASPGEDVTVNITSTTDGGFKDLVVKKLWDGTVQEEETLTTLPASYTYTVVDEDADHIVTLNFTVSDNKGKTASKDLVITVELTPLQVLLKYNWRLDAEIWKETGENEIQDVYTDDVYRFNADGTYNKSIGEKVDDFNDLWYNYCYYDLNETSMRLLMSRTGAFAEQVTDTLDITLIDETEMKADVTYYGLNTLPGGEKYDAAEDFEKQFVAVPKVATFDPYKPGATDDTSGPANMCTTVEFEND